VVGGSIRLPYLEIVGVYRFFLGAADVYFDVIFPPWGADVGVYYFCLRSWLSMAIFFKWFEESGGGLGEWTQGMLSLVRMRAEKLGVVELCQYIDGLEEDTGLVPTPEMWWMRVKQTF
jgi:hypothetical protein